MGGVQKYQSKALAFTQHANLVEPHIEPNVAASDPLFDVIVTPSMRSMVKWVWTVFLLGVVNVMMGYYVGHMSINENPKIPTWFRFPQWMTENITYTVARTYFFIFSKNSSLLQARKLQFAR